MKNIQAMAMVAISTVFLVRSASAFTPSKIIGTRISTSTNLSTRIADIQSKYINTRTTRNFQSSTVLFAAAVDKARVLFLGTPEVAATSLQRIVEESQKEER
jgi:uncharacterized protein (DUF1810 family)